MSERIGRTLCAICMLADRAFPSSMSEELSTAAVYLNNRTPQRALNMETLFQMLHGKEADLLRLRLIGARTFVHVKDSRKLNATA